MHQRSRQSGQADYLMLLLRIRQARTNSRTGKSLSKTCEEWRATVQRYDSFTSQQEMRKACERYERFLETGIAPPGTLQ